ncbi:hypothetical protein [Endozoicomonas lisbonensis]|uniref:hypothetical protein n=1 Tax=Endozoicomonas lisbonensis TaxID=3120522 RepID=UPI0033988DDC
MPYGENCDLVKYLCKNGADVNAKDQFGNTPFSLAKKIRADHIATHLNPSALPGFILKARQATS